MARELNHDAATSELAFRDWPLPLGKSHIILRALCLKDVDSFLSYRSDPEVARHQGWSTMDASTAIGVIKMMQDVAGPRGDAWIQLGIALVESNRLIGDIRLWLSRDGKEARISYSCAPQFQRQGLTTEVVIVLINALVDYTTCETVQALVDSRNIASERLLLCLCFRKVEPTGPMSDFSDSQELTYALDLRDRRMGCE